MIDIRQEQVISLTDAAQLSVLPKRRRGKKPHVATLYRWAQRGVRGVRLETIRVGGTLCTSAAALQRFFNRLSGETRHSLPASDSDASIDADRKLSEQGI